MLADEIDRLVGGGFDRATGGGLSLLAQHVSEAARFVLAPDATAAVGEIGRSKSTSLVHALDFARVPFRSCWIEWVPSDLGTILDNGKQVPSRVGLLLRCHDDTGTRFGTTITWMHPKTSGTTFGDPVAFTISTVGLDVDMSSTVRSGVPGFSPAVLAGQWRTDPQERDALTNILSHITPSMCGYMGHFLKTNFDLGDTDRIRRHLDSFTGDAAQEACRVLAVLCLLNSRTHVTTEAVDLAVLNRARQRRGARKLLEYSEVRIGLSRRDQAAAAEAGASPTDVRRHIVRGHFKVRRKGIYWWRPFLRGSAEMGAVTRSSYVFGSTARAVAVPA